MKEKKKKIFFNKKNIKNKNLLRKKQKFITDQKFLRKYKKEFKNNGEKYVEVTRADPIENFFFTPTGGETKEESDNKANYEGNENEKSKKTGNIDTTLGVVENDKSFEKRDKSNSSYKNSNTNMNTNTNSNDVSFTDVKQYNNSQTNKLIVGFNHPGKKKGKKKSVYTKELNLMEDKKNRDKIAKVEKEAIFLKSEKEKKEKRSIRFKKFKALNKKTKSGQPLMKNVIKHLLQKI
ncbi:rRNA-processing protein, putative [Hepatocystis sp. ex Piliocolobus tephrosceles]|nr:rRNA-processing protein, putative [Hepatocystis sp. ex Piliocolobus tephrosceles]